MLNTKTIAELKQFCDDFGIEYTKNARKQDVISVIEESGLTFDDYQGSSLGFKDYVPEVKEEVNETEIKEIVPEVSNEQTLLTTIAGIGAYVRGIKFESDNPFTFVEKNLAQLLINEPGYGVREASVEEYNNFNGIG
jgi:hypothetical protein